ncbi:hypothetical protein [Haloferula sp. BvORR071]|uniref:hypothetical protein n=1 Tax=Haloferula sp. BvORR071 TaxID=1396141 RepID=UPI000698FB29|nr:hypothetical protein [Haloferula sp. BvORR071]
MAHDWQTFTVRVLQGHRVASGLNGNPRFPGGTLRMQAPFFRELGVDLDDFYPGTINVSLAPQRYVVRQARHTFRNLKWHPVEPAEDFSFFDIRLLLPGQEPLEGFVYYPHPETKPEHFQQPDVLELLLPKVEGLHYGMELTLQVPEEQMAIEEIAPTIVHGDEAR